MRLRIGIWNVEWRSWRSSAGKSIVGRMWGQSPEVVCITEGRAETPERIGGHWISAEGSYGYRNAENRRKVMLWSRAPWTDVVRVGPDSMPGGRFVSGRTETSIGEITVTGVCVPWRDAHVRSGRRDRQPWEDHEAYLRALKQVMAGHRGRERVILLGDFNQRVPRLNSPAPVYELLMKATEGFTWGAQGAVPGLKKPVIDHLLHSVDLEVESLFGFEPFDGDGKRLSDHPGIVVDLEGAVRRQAAGSDVT